MKVHVRHVLSNMISIHSKTNLESHTTTASSSEICRSDLTFMLSVQTLNLLKSDFVKQELGGVYENDIQTHKSMTNGNAAVEENKNTAKATKNVLRTQHKHFRMSITNSTE